MRYLGLLLLLSGCASSQHKEFAEDPSHHVCVGRADQIGRVVLFCGSGLDMLELLPDDTDI